MWEEHRTERIGLIDLGSNSARFVVMEILPNQSYHLIYQDKRAVRLSEGMSETGKLTAAARQRTLDALDNFSHTAALLGVDHMSAVATAAMRNAPNGISFRDEIETRTGIPLTVISGREEARLGYLGVVNTIPHPDFILFDLGGASMEVSLVRNRHLVQAVSLPIGALTLTEKYRTTDKVSKSAKENIRQEVREALTAISGIENAKLPVIGIGGTVRNLAKIQQRRTEYPIPKLHQYQMSAAVMKDLENLLTSKNLADRGKISGLAAERADIICAGTMIIRNLLEYVAAEELIISGCGLREGLFYHYYAMQYCSGRQFPDNMIYRSVMNYRGTLPLDNDQHMTYVTDMALRMYDGLQAIYAMPARHREYLETAARLHDTGMMINYYSHAKHSAYLIANAPIYGMTHREQAICALIAGFQDGISNKLTRFATYFQLLEDDDIETVKRLSLLLALAKNLDRTHDQGIADLHLSQEDTQAVLHLTARDNDDIPLIETALAPHVKLFPRYYGVPLRLCWDIDSRNT